MLVHTLPEGKSNQDVITLATAVEIIHTASLVHDDILDDADTRRQRKTVHEAFGPDVAVLSGDFLFAHASGLIESLENDEVTRLVSLVIEQFGYGELSQSAKKFDIQLSLFDYMKKSFYKTASLLAAACRASAVLTGPSREVCDVMYSYGFYLGVAFQIADDVLDFIGSDEELGKPAAQDLRDGLLTAPVILCMNGNADLGIDPSPRANELRTLVNRRFSGGNDDLQRALQLVREDGGVEMAYRLAERMANKALEALTLAAPIDSDARQSLAGLTRWAVRRST
jgi:all-trans-nonaprenyl-diphosphate synthase